MRLLEREHPLGVLQDRAHRAVEGRGGIVLVAGEAGIGKTVLLRDFAARTPAARTLWGMCDALSTPRPLGPLRDVADALDPAVAALLRDRTAAPHEIFAAVLDALCERPRVLVVEDLHWADEATLDLVRFLGRRVAALPLLLVLSYRDAGGAGPPLSAVLGDLVCSPDARRLQLAPLSRTAVADLLHGSGLDADEVHRRTGGNPFFVSQILAQPDARLPQSVRDAVIARTAGLAPDVRRSLELLSCAPEAVGGELLAALGVAEATLEALTRTGLVERRGSGVAFRHEITRAVVLEAAPPGVEQGMHGFMAAALEAVGGDASVLTHHAAAAGDVKRVRRYAPAAAADAARSGAHREAVAFFELALRHTTDDDAAGRAALLEALSTELYLTDRLDAAITARTRALALRAALGDEVAVGTAHYAISHYAWYGADRAAAEHHDETAITLLARTPDRRALGFALANHAYLAAHRGDVPEALRAGAEARRIAEDLGGDAELDGTAAIGVGIVRLLGGDVDGRAELAAASRVGLRHRIDELATAPMANLVHLDVEQGRFAEAEEALSDALRVSEERNVPICTMWQRGVRARLRLLQGRWREAEDDARGVLASGQLPLGRLWPHLVLGLLLARREAPVENPHLDELWRLATRLRDPGKVAPAAAALAEQAWITGRADPRLEAPPAAGLAALAFAGSGQVLPPLLLWHRRLAAAGVQRIRPSVAGGTAPVPDGQPYERAFALWDAGSAEALRTALGLLDELGARAVATRMRTLPGRAGNGSGGRARPNPAGLTGRQLDVLALLVEGRSNADIAARLVISPKTADHHVSAILAKLGARSRGEAAAVARRLGL